VYDIRGRTVLYYSTPRVDCISMHAIPNASTQITSTIARSSTMARHRPEEWCMASIGSICTNIVQELYPAVEEATFVEIKWPSITWSWRIHSREYPNNIRVQLKSRLGNQVPTHYRLDSSRNIESMQDIDISTFHNYSGASYSREGIDDWWLPPPWQRSKTKGRKI
jgi:hypothetical protein